MDEQRIGSLGLLSEYANRGAVDTQCQVRLAFRLVDRGVGGRVDDHVRVRRAHCPSDCIGVDKIERCMIGRDGRVEDRLELRADLAVAAGQQDLHGKTSASLRYGAAASRFESSGWPSKGHLIAMSGSSQRMTRSCAGSQKSVSL